MNHDYGQVANVPQQESQSTEHLLGIFASLLRLLPGGSASRIRVLAKFIENDYRKIEKLVNLRREYASKVSPVEQAIEKERKTFTPDEQEAMAGLWLSQRLDAGLFPLQVRLLEPFPSSHYSLIMLTITEVNRCYLGLARRRR